MKLAWPETRKQFLGMPCIHEVLISLVSVPYRRVTRVNRSARYRWPTQASRVLLQPRLECAFHNFLLAEIVGSGQLAFQRDSLEGSGDFRTESDRDRNQADWEIRCLLLATALAVMAVQRRCLWFLRDKSPDGFRIRVNGRMNPLR
jgi:hypothetical protein